MVFVIYSFFMQYYFKKWHDSNQEVFIRQSYHRFEMR